MGWSDAGYSVFCAHSFVPMSYLVIEFYNCNLTFFAGECKRMSPWGSSPNKRYLKLPHFFRSWKTIPILLIAHKGPGISDPSKTMSKPTFIASDNKIYVKIIIDLQIYYLLCWLKSVINFRKCLRLSPWPRISCQNLSIFGNFSSGHAQKIYTHSTQSRLPLREQKMWRKSISPNSESWEG